MDDLYQEIIMEHNRNPKNFGTIDRPDVFNEAFNPLCGDSIKIYLKFDGNKIKDIKFRSEGCAISKASASLMTELLLDQDTSTATNTINEFHKMITKNENNDYDQELLGDSIALSNLSKYPNRIKCATMCWHAAKQSIQMVK